MSVAIAGISLSQRMHKHAWVHGDSHLGNFMYMDGNSYAIDFERSIIRVGPKQHWLDIQIFLAISAACSSTSHTMMFWTCMIVLVSITIGILQWLGTDIILMQGNSFGWMKSQFVLRHNGWIKSQFILRCKTLHMLPDCSSMHVLHQLYLLGKLISRDVSFAIQCLILQLHFKLHVWSLWIDDTRYLSLGALQDGEWVQVRKDWDHHESSQLCGGPHLSLHSDLQHLKLPWPSHGGWDSWELQIEEKGGGESLEIDEDFRVDANLVSELTLSKQSVVAMKRHLYLPFIIKIPIP